MEYNISARKPNMELKKKLAEAAEQANKLVSDIDFSHMDFDKTRDILREYIRIRYLLEPSDMISDSLNYLGEASLSRSLGMPIEEVRASELDAKCENTSSSMTKKILLVIALNSALGIDINAEATANIATVSELCEEVCHQLEAIAA